MDISPPKLSIMYTENNLFYNCDRKRYMRFLTLSNLISCGWFVRRSIIYNNPESGVFVGKLELEYYGNCVCALIGYYPFWGSLSDCENSMFCEDYEGW